MRKEYVWWKHGVVYQIYPRSFYDSNGDGIGDLAGITEKLDYLADLGIDAIWLSPIYESPMFDFGYDISDYRSIDPAFGTMKDFETLIKKAHKKKIKVITDMVANHTSYKHQWFIESSSSRNNPKADWYIWHDGINGKPPNNWLAMFGGKAWEWCEQRQQFYLHSFLKEQPDLNWRNKKVQKAVFDDMKFWLDRGVDGFRLDVINFLIKDDTFRSNPLTLKAPNPRPYDLQKHLYDRNQVENHEIMKALRKMTDKYKDRMMVGEIYDAFPEPELSAKYLGNGTDQLHLAFEFSIMYNKKWHAKTFYNYAQNYYKALPEKGWPTLAFNNHDQPRSRSRFGGGRFSLDRAKTAAVFLLTAWGTPFIYYGEELGMEDGTVDKDDIHDPVGIKYWPFNKGRDPERTPMLWDSSENSGFSKVQPWLPINKNWKSIHAEAQKIDADSILQVYKTVISLRKNNPALTTGTISFLTDGSKNLLVFNRSNSKQEILVIINFSSKVKEYQIDAKHYKLLYSTLNNQSRFMENCNLSPLEAVIIERIKV